MTRTLVRELPGRIGEQVTVRGWVDTTRLQRTMQFVLLRDHTGLVQLTNRRAEPASAVEQTLQTVSIESAVEVTGTVVANKIVKLGGLELVPSQVSVVNAAEAPLPVNEQTGIDQRLDWRFLDLRHPDRQLIFAVQSALENATREFALRHGATELHTPKLMGTASESGAEVFRVEYFGTTAYLAQSPQFYKQLAIAGGIDRVFEVGPVFRAEPSYTSRHATEFTGIDVELAWIEGVEDVMAFEEQMLAFALTRVRDEFGPLVRERFGVEVTVPSLPFPRLPMALAQELLASNGWSGPVKGDLDPAGERLLSSLVKERYGHEFVFVTEFPAGVRPFYHLRTSAQVTASFDLLWNGLEITTGAQREHRHDVLVAQAREKGMTLEPLRSYLDSFRYGMPPHGGFGAGLNRILMVALGLDSIREATFLFRGPNRLTP